ncbi:acetolactate synthase I/II/III large subunit [Fusarium oxysporum f. sp. lycopersici 4287]|uniref:Acetolactate synthase I/II/III large subunit n=1 Tax=Fusarium oxysporum f. sp. lycopersici (strain 4287 / CBS 123668 / FGSC 9935 / NRRL 34936) TaxID=426428 RepID=A0A0J9V4R5_FUSO4|nr:acetolactate synthase I/II/III large subunit [Fusarium oxysporum f. sp. lycopersici 4287]KNB06148.1 acetolactate synthase I/II/III large subunit [Fusarium oxysporum f. sp. lycopersici 4287]
MSMQEADLIIALGGHFDDRVTGNTGQFAPGAKPAVLEDRGGIVHFEIMPTNISRVVRATQAVEGDVATNLQLLIPLAEERSMSDRKEWFHQINEWKRKWPLNDYERAGESGRMKSQEMVEQLSNLIQGRKANTLITNGVGQHQVWTA